MNNFNKDINKNSKDKNYKKLDKISEKSSDEKSIEKNNKENVNSAILKRQMLIKKENSNESKKAKENSLENQLSDLHRNQIEASLYVAGRPLSIEELSTKLEIPKKEVEKLIQDVAFDYLGRSTALVINQVGDDFQMTLKTEYVEKVSKFAKGGAIAERYLRTLTIIALKQPILKSLVVKLRGSGAYEHIKYLLDNNLISAIKKGRSQELTTTDKYSEMFGLPKDKEELKRIMITQLRLENEK